MRDVETSRKPTSYNNTQPGETEETYVERCTSGLCGSVIETASSTCQQHSVEGLDGGLPVECVVVVAAPSEPSI